MKRFSVQRKIGTLSEFYATEGGRGPWDLLGYIAVNNYTWDLVPLGLTKAADPRWILRKFRERHSKMKKQRKESRIQRRDYHLTWGKDVAQRAVELPKMGPLIGPCATRDCHRFFTSSDPEDAAVYSGHLSCHMWNCPPCLQGKFRDCIWAQKGLIGPWNRLGFNIKNGTKRSRDT